MLIMQAAWREILSEIQKFSFMKIAYVTVDSKNDAHFVVVSLR